MAIKKKLVKRSKRAIKIGLSAAGKRIPAVRRAYRGALASRRRRRYEALWQANPVDKRTVVFECYGGRGYSCSPRALYKAMLADERFCDYELVWSFRSGWSKWLRRALGQVELTEEQALNLPEHADRLARVFGNDALEELSHAKIVTHGSHDYYEALARSGTWISNFILPTHMQLRDGQVYLQTWHGSPLKRLGCDLAANVRNATSSVTEIYDRYIAEGARFTYLVSPSSFATDKLSTAFALPTLGQTDKVIEEGYPRNDALTQTTPEHVAAIRERLNLPADKKLLLYAPTWRDDQHQSGIGYTYSCDVDFDYLRRELGDDYVILFRAHYLVAKDFDFEQFAGFVYDVSDVSDINDLYVVSDMLITDYSSVFFDYAILERPTIFYMYDFDAYANDLRGFYLQLDELPGPIVRDEQALVEQVRAAENPTEDDSARAKKFLERFGPLDDGHASERVLSHIFPGEASPECEAARDLAG